MGVGGSQLFFRRVDIVLNVLGSPVDLGLAPFLVSTSAVSRLRLSLLLAFASCPLILFLFLSLLLLLVLLLARRPSLVRVGGCCAIGAQIFLIPLRFGDFFVGLATTNPVFKSIVVFAVVSAPFDDQLNFRRGDTELLLVLFGVPDADNDVPRAALSIDVDNTGTVVALAMPFLVPVGTLLLGDVAVAADTSGCKDAWSAVLTTCVSASWKSESTSLSVD